MKKKIALLVTACLIAGLFIGGAPKSEDEVEDQIVLKVALALSDTSSGADGARKIAEEVALATDNQIILEIYTGGSLGGERDTIEMVMQNNIDIAICANAVLTNFVPEMGILDQAYLWADIDEAHEAIDGTLGELVKESCAEQGIYVIGFMESGFRNTISTTPIETIEDFKGVTIRTMENTYHQAAFESFGSMPVIMSYNDVFTALQQGTIDAAENALDVCYSAGYQEVCQYVTMTQHAFVYNPLCMSESAWERIPEDLRETFLEAVQRGVEAQREYVAEANEQAIEDMEAQGVEFFEIDIEELQAAYNEKAEKAGYEFDSEWQAAVDEVTNK